MPKVILFSQYTNSRTHKMNYIKYTNSKGMLTENVANEVTPRQRELIELIMENEYNSEQIENFESYKEYQQNPSKQNASDFLTEALEIVEVEQLHQTAYLDYITNRKGSQGLFSTGGAVDYNLELEKIKKFNGNIYMQVFSLKKEDAIKLGYDTPENWRLAFEKKMPAIAQAMKIPLHRLEWNGAFHESKTHPHVHLMVWDKENKAYQNAHSLEKMRSIMTNEIFSEEMEPMKMSLQNTKKNFYQLTQDSIKKQIMGNTSAKLTKKIFELSEKLEQVEGKKNYAYLQKEVKEEINTLVYEYIKDPEAKESLSVYLNSYKNIATMYNDKDKVINSKVKKYRNELINPRKKNTNRSLHNLIVNLASENKDLLENMVKYNEEKSKVLNEMYRRRISWIIKNRDEFLLNKYLYSTVNNPLPQINLENVSEKIDFSNYILTGEKKIEFELFNQKTQLWDIYSRARRIANDELVKQKWISAEEEKLLRKCTNTLDLKNEAENKNIKLEIEQIITEKYLAAINIEQNREFQEFFEKMSANKVYSYDELDSEYKELLHDFIKSLITSNDELEAELSKYLSRRMKRDFVNQITEISLEKFIKNNREEYFEKFYAGEYTKVMHYEAMSAINNFREHQKEFDLEKHKKLVINLLKNIDNFDLQKKSQIPLDTTSDIRINGLKEFLNKIEQQKITENLRIVMKALTIAGSNSDEVKLESYKLLSKVTLQTFIPGNNRGNGNLSENQKDKIFNDALKKLTKEILMKEKYDNDLKMNFNDQGQFEKIAGKTFKEAWKEEYFTDCKYRNYFIITLITTLVSLFSNINNEEDDQQRKQRNKEKNRKQENNLGLDIN
jgi:hypothetical protein